MKMSLKVLGVMLIVISIYSCNRDRSSDVSKSVFMDMADIDAPKNDNALSAPKPALNDVSIDQQIVNKKKIIKDGTISIESDNIKESKRNIDLLVKTFDGYTSNESYTDENNTSAYTLKIRVPSNNFDSIIAAIEKGSKSVLSKNISARDVTEEFIDLEIRLKNKQNYLSKYNELLKQAKSVQDILSIEEKNRIIEEEIESTEGRLKYLNDQVSYSTLEVTIVVKKEYLEKPFFKGNFFKRTGIAIVSGWFGAIEFCIYLFRIWPLFLISILCIIIVRRIKRNHKMKQNRQ